MCTEVGQLIIPSITLVYFLHRIRFVRSSIHTHTIIQRTTKLGEAPSFGETIIMHDAMSKGAINYLNRARELLQKNNLTAIPSEDKNIGTEDQDEADKS